MTEIDVQDIQGLVFSGYSTMSHASYHLLKITDEPDAKKWLKNLVTEGKVTDGQERRVDWCQNIAFTADGLRRFGLQESDIDSFEQTFIDGMCGNTTSKTLGDTGKSDPANWDWGHGTNVVDVVLLLFAKDEQTNSALIASETERYIEHGLLAVDTIHADPASRHLTKRFQTEHFGFADGISQPSVKEFPSKNSEADDLQAMPCVSAGEFVLGYHNEYGEFTNIPEVSDGHEDRTSPFGRNGTYLVIRQLAQDVGGFWNQARKHSVSGDDEEFIAAKMVGRWPSGCVVHVGEKTDPLQDPTNNFDYSDTDALGYGCPLGSHIRRTNPRDVGLGESPDSSVQVANRHRLIRRGRRYGPIVQDKYDNDDEDRGLLFVAINANIERQFEFVQHTWVNNTKFSGHYDEQDPLIGFDPNQMTIPEKPLRRNLTDVASFVATRGGAYFFLPGIEALRTLASPDLRSPIPQSKLRPKSDDIPCPALLSFYNNGLLEPQTDGTVNLRHLAGVLGRVGISPAVAKVLTKGAGKTDSKADSFNLFGLRDSSLDHTGSTGIRDPMVSERIFSETMTFAEYGRIYAKHFALIASHCRRKNEDRIGTVIQTVEFAAVLALFGRVDKFGNRFLYKDDMHALWLRGEYPKHWHPPRTNSLGPLPVLRVTLVIGLWRFRHALRRIGASRG